MDSADGQMRISRDVAVQIDGVSNELSVLSDAAGVIGEELILALVNGGGEMELRVKVVESRPHVVNGAVRHRVRLAVLAVESRSADRGTERTS